MRLSQDVDKGEGYSLVSLTQREPFCVLIIINVKCSVFGNTSYWVMYLLLKIACTTQTSERGWATEDYMTFAVIFFESVRAV